MRIKKNAVDFVMLTLILLLLVATMSIYYAHTTWAAEVGVKPPAERVIEVNDELHEVELGEIIEEQKPTYTDEELYIIAHLLCGECQTGSWELQEAVGSVVLNRVASPNYPNTIKKVVFQRGQYACTWDGNYDRVPTERNWAVAKHLLENGSQIPANVVYQAQFKQGKGVWKKIKGEIFCYQ